MILPDFAAKAFEKFVESQSHRRMDRLQELLVVQGLNLKTRLRLKFEGRQKGVAVGRCLAERNSKASACIRRVGHRD